MKTSDSKEIIRILRSAADGLEQGAYEHIEFTSTHDEGHEVVTESVFTLWVAYT